MVVSQDFSLIVLGNYFPDLSNQIQKKLEKLDPSCKIPDNNIS